MDKLKKFFDIKFLKFVLVGIINTIVGEGIVLLLLNLFGWKSHDWGVGLAPVIGTVVGSIVSYILNKHFTFKNKEKGVKPMLRFTVNILVCLLLRVVAATAVYNLSKAMSLSMLWMDVETFAANLSWAVGAVVFLGCNYVGQRFFAFKEKTESEEKLTIDN